MYTITHLVIAKMIMETPVIDLSNVEENIHYRLQCIAVTVREYVIYCSYGKSNSHLMFPKSCLFFDNICHYVNKKSIQNWILFLTLHKCIIIVLNSFYHINVVSLRERVTMSSWKTVSSDFLQISKQIQRKCYMRSYSHISNCFWQKVL